MRNFIVSAITAAVITGCGKAEPGPAGPSGAQGERGVAGSVGEAGKSGVDGNVGKPGVDGNTNHIVRSTYCQETFYGIDISYNYVLMSTGDAFVSGSIEYYGDQWSSSNFYAKGQGGAASGSVVIGVDLIPPYDNGGWWNIHIGEDGTSVVVDYSDTGGPYGYVFAAESCSIQAW